MPHALDSELFPRIKEQKYTAYGPEFRVATLLTRWCRFLSNVPLQRLSYAARSRIFSLLKRFWLFRSPPLTAKSFRHTFDARWYYHFICSFFQEFPRAVQRHYIAGRSYDIFDTFKDFKSLHIDDIFMPAAEVSLSFYNIFLIYCLLMMFTTQKLFSIVAKSRAPWILWFPRFRQNYWYRKKFLKRRAATLPFAMGWKYKFRFILPSIGPSTAELSAFYFFHRVLAPSLIRISPFI